MKKTIFLFICILLMLLVFPESKEQVIKDFQKLPGKFSSALSSASNVDSAPKSASDAFGYMYLSNQDGESVSFDWIDISATGSDMMLSDDDYDYAVLSFPFVFYDGIYDTVFIQSNGAVTFNNSYLTLANAALPFGARDLIAILWDDLNPNTGGSIYFQDFGTYAVIQFDSIPYYYDTNPNTFELILYANGDIKLQYLDITGYFNSTIGIQDSSAYNEGNLWYLEYLYSGSPSGHIPEDSTAILFTLPRYNTDISLMSINSPGEYAGRDEDITPVIRVRNNGLEDNSLFAVLIIDSMGSFVYADVYNLSLASGEDTILTMRPWHTGNAFGIVYNITGYVRCDGDEMPSNDTIRTECIIDPWFDGPSMPDVKAGGYSGTSFANDTSYLHYFGGGYDEISHYIFNGQYWYEGTPLPEEMVCGAYCTVGENIYIIGSFNQNDTMMYIYNASDDTYSSRRLPEGINDAAAVSYLDRYIYIIGGDHQNFIPEPSVVLYDIIGDSFFTNVTQLPTGMERLGGIAGYLGSNTMVYAGGIDTTGGLNEKTIVGIIDQYDPSVINWLYGPDLPVDGVLRFGGGVYNGRLIMAGGLNYAGATSEAFMYKHGTGWIQLPDMHTAKWGNTGCIYKYNGEDCFAVCGGYDADMMNSLEVYYIEAMPSGIIIQKEDGIEETSVMFLNKVEDEFTDVYLNLSSTETVDLKIYDLQGRQIDHQIFSNVQPGSHTLRWNHTSFGRKKVSSGTYFIMIDIDGNKYNGKTIIIK